MKILGLFTFMAMISIAVFICRQFVSFGNLYFVYIQHICVRWPCLFAMIPWCKNARENYISVQWQLTYWAFKLYSLLQLKSCSHAPSCNSFLPDYGGIHNISSTQKECLKMKMFQCTWKLLSQCSTLVERRVKIFLKTFVEWNEHLAGITNDYIIWNRMKDDIGITSGKTIDSISPKTIDIDKYTERKVKI